ncbi:hypothetical protein SAMN05443665_104483 [Actinomadura meyerae]|uniref:Uncharacterized protein n=1 Tax=Actinomadura meyerae TaxID=240840 RepID=A0A239NP26_9ACTN|nr:hypothetical protein [Actinomadura meyerae]SNT56114.1 hypothetical protein SAMN05443665_104483 [Actinomadura meyerae]
MTNRPTPDQFFNVDMHRAIWPMGSEKIELYSGHPLFYGSFDEADAEAAERAFPGRRATIEPWYGRRGNLILHASTCSPETCSEWPAERA